MFESVISGWGKYLPEKTISNEELVRRFPTSDEWIQTRTGIKERREADLDQGTSDLGTQAAKAALKSANISIDQVDLILAATQTPDHYFPGIGVQIQKKLGAPNTPAIDIRGQCAGFTWSLSIADNFIKAGSYQTILIVGAEIQSRFLDNSITGRDLAVILADGGGSVLLQKKSAGMKSNFIDSKIVDHVMGSDGSGFESLIMRNPGMHGGNPDFTGGENGRIHPEFHGPILFKNAVIRMRNAIKSLLQRNCLSKDDIDMIIPHQANQRIMDAVADGLEVSRTKVFSNIANYGNIGSASIPIALSESIEQQRIRRGSKVIFVSFGAGYTWGANLLVF